MHRACMPGQQAGIRQEHLQPPALATIDLYDKAAGKATCHVANPTHSVSPCSLSGSFCLHTVAWAGRTMKRLRTPFDEALFSCALARPDTFSPLVRAQSGAQAVPPFTPPPGAPQRVSRHAALLAISVGTTHQEPPKSCSKNMAGFMYAWNPAQPPISRGSTRTFHLPLCTRKQGRWHCRALQGGLTATRMF